MRNQFRTAIAAAACILAANAAATAAVKAVATGSYECWANGQARMLMNFTVTGAGAYRASDGSNGRFTLSPATGAVAFTGYMKDVMPDGFVAVYHEKNGKPTVSFRSPRGSEAAFCEKAAR
ncbi:MAG: hypothetical protein AB7P02_09650 [Alphaproteobacteria bacterium]